MLQGITPDALPYHAAKAVAISPAQIFGVSGIMGSLEKGKLANIVLADADLLEFRTNIRKVYVDGKETDLSSHFTELLDKYKSREEKKKREKKHESGLD